MQRRARAGQTTVELMLLVSVVVIAVVAAGWWLAGGESGIVAGLESFSQGAQNAYVDPNDVP